MARLARESCCPVPSSNTWAGRHRTPGSMAPLDLSVGAFDVTRRQLIPEGVNCLLH